MRSPVPWVRRVGTVAQSVRAFLGTRCMRKITKHLAVLSVPVWLVIVPHASFAQEEEVIRSGQAVFNQKCAVCHGVDAKGGGELAQYLTVKPANLTQLSKNNDGVFAFWDVYRTIDGRTAVKGHGPRDMPVWGTNESGISPQFSGHLRRGQILELIFYLESIQEE